MNTKAFFTSLLLCSVLSSMQVSGGERCKNENDALKQELRELRNIVTELANRIEDLERRLAEVQKRRAVEFNGNNTSQQPAVFGLDLNLLDFNLIEDTGKKRPAKPNHLWEENYADPWSFRHTESSWIIGAIVFPGEDMSRFISPKK